MRKRFVALIAAMMLTLSLVGTVAAQGPGAALGPIVSAPTDENFRAFCVINHGVVFGPGAIGDASSARGGANADIYRPGGVAEQVCRPIVAAQ